MTIGSLAPVLRGRPRSVRILVTVEAVVLALVAAFLILGRAGFVGGPFSYVVVSGHSMEPGLHTGDVVVLKRGPGYRRGEVIGYKVPKGGPGAGLIVIHRIIGGGPRDGYIMKGDNKTGPDPWRPQPSNVVGREILTVPEIGLWIAYLRTPLGIAALAGLITLSIALGGSSRDRRSPEPVNAPTPVSDSRWAACRRCVTTWRRIELHGRRRSSSQSPEPSASAASERRTLS